MKKINDLINLLGNDREEMRAQAIKALAEIGAPAVDPLIKAFQRKSAQEGAVEALVSIGQPAIEPLKDAYQTSYIRSVREGAAYALEKLGISVEE